LIFLQQIGYKLIEENQQKGNRLFMTGVNGNNNQSIIGRLFHTDSNPKVNPGIALPDKIHEGKPELNITSSREISENGRKGIIGSIFQFGDSSDQKTVKIPAGVKIGASAVLGGVTGVGFGSFIGEQIGQASLRNVTPGFTTENVAELLAFHSKEKAIFGGIICAGIAGAVAFAYFNDKK
jgi:hypothetical protein